MSTLTATSTWQGPIDIPEHGCFRIQCRVGGPILICSETPAHDDDGYLLKQGESRLVLHSPGHPSFWVKARVPGSTADVFYGGETLFG